MRLRAFPLPIKDNTKNSSLTHPVHQNLKQESSAGGGIPWQKNQLQGETPKSRKPLPPSEWLSVPAARVTGGAPGRAARFGDGRLGASVRVVGGQHHAARVLHFHRQPRMSRLRPENKGGNQHGPAHQAPGPCHQRGSRARPAPKGSLRAVRGSLPRPPGNPISID